MKTVCTYYNLAEAGFAHSLLEASGIDAALLDESAGSVLGATSILGGMRLQVPEDEFDRALEVLKNHIPDSDESASAAPVVSEHEVKPTAE